MKNIANFFENLMNNSTFARQFSNVYKNLYLFHFHFRKTNYSTIWKIYFIYCRFSA